MASHGITRGTGTIARSKEARQKELQQIAAYQDLVALVNAKIAERQYTVEVLSLITKLLTENPEYYTIWNHRRRVLNELLIASSDTGKPSDPPATPAEDTVKGDIQLTFTLLRQFPKCYWIWNHRNWILQKAESILETGIARKLWLGELQLVSKMLHSDSRNFHAWSYRRFVVGQLERIPTSTGLESLTESEFEYTTKMINTNLSNFSAWHNRSKLIPRLLNERDADDAARRKLLDSELALICTAINTDPFDQSIWFYHQYLMSTLSPQCPRNNLIALDLNNLDRLRYYEHEMNYIQEILDDETDCKWIYEALLSLAASYLNVEGGTGAFTTRDMNDWLDALKRLDPLHKGRWKEFGSDLNL